MKIFLVGSFLVLWWWLSIKFLVWVISKVKTTIPGRGSYVRSEHKYDR